MTRIAAGLGAGFIATLVLSALMIAKAMTGLMPHLNVIHMLASMSNGSALEGWIIHFVIGTVAWGGAFAIFHDRLPGASDPAKGMSLAVAAWLAMMLVVMPLAGAGVFGLKLGLMAPIMTLVLHLVYGAVLGFAFHRLSAPRLLHS